jgi:hypothetical protein
MPQMVQFPWHASDAPLNHPVGLLTPFLEMLPLGSIAPDDPAHAGRFELAAYAVREEVITTSG